MTTFQEMTQVEGGEYFIARFFQAETARLGMSEGDYVAQCQKAAAIYKFTVDELCQ